MSINKCIIFLIILFLNILDYANAGTAYLDILSEPEKVMIEINNKEVGVTPLTGIEVESGITIIRASKYGYGTATQELDLNPDDLKTIRIELSPTKDRSGEVEGSVVLRQDKGALLLINKLGNVNVYIDGIKKGSGSIKIVDVSAGEHNIKVMNFVKNIVIVKDHILKIKVDSNGIQVLEKRNIYHTVIPGDTLYQICQKYGISVKDIRILNNLSDRHVLKVGDKLIVSQ
jgi:LysM repeat protein